MGTSRSILFYGFLIGDGVPPWYDEAKEDTEEENENTWDEWREALARKKGLPTDYDGTEKATKDLKCHMDVHGCAEYPEYYVAVTDSEIISYDGEPKIIYPGRMKQNKKWDLELVQFCQLLEIIPPQDFNWYMTAFWEH